LANELDDALGFFRRISAEGRLVFRFLQRWVW